MNYNLNSLHDEIQFPFLIVLAKKKRYWMTQEIYDTLLSESRRDFMLVIHLFNINRYFDDKNNWILSVDDDNAEKIKKEYPSYFEQQS